MARYDRIAPLAAPARDNAFPAWTVLLDLGTNDRDNELSRRARLRFLALRPARRLLDRGMAAVGRESYIAQLEAVREELGYLPARDVERARIARFLHLLEERDATRVFNATLEMAEACATGGQTYGAEEYALTALGLAEANNLSRLQGSAQTTLARIYRMRGGWADAERHATRAAEIAELFGSHSDLVQARAEQAMIAIARGDHEAGIALLTETRKQMRTAADLQAETLAAAKLCACENAAGNAAAALEHGWSALRQLEDLRERALLLEQVGIAFSNLGLYKAAERCFSMVAQRGVDPALRARARAAQAAQAAAAGVTHIFRERRSALLNDAVEWHADPRISAFVHVELGRGSFLAGDMAVASEHLRNAISVARSHSLPDMLARAEGVLAALEHDARLAPAHGNDHGADAARRIAEQFETLPDLTLIPA